jgi:hypothetical protein
MCHTREYYFRASNLPLLWVASEGWRAGSQLYVRRSIYSSNMAPTCLVSEHVNEQKRTAEVGFRKASLELPTAFLLTCWVCFNVLKFHVGRGP